MNDLKKIGQALAGIAPTIASALLPGVGGVVAGSAIKAVTAALGAPDGHPPQDLAKMLESGLAPKDMTALRKADNDFAIQMRELDIKLEDLHREDRSDARQMQVRTRSVVPGALSLIVVAAFIGLVGYVAHEAFNPPMHGAAVDSTLMNLVFSVVSYAAGAATTVLTYWFGSSQSSEDTNQHLADAAKSK